jgi:hypothetical protein
VVTLVLCGTITLVLCGTNSLCGHILLNLGYWVVQPSTLTCKYVLITCESSVGAFLLIVLLQLYPCYYDMHIIFFPHLLSTNHKCTQPY